MVVSSDGLTKFEEGSTENSEALVMLLLYLLSTAHNISTISQGFAGCRRLKLYNK
jgi:hypothetical protein